MKRRRLNKKFIIVLLILFISIGFAYLTTNLNITGLAILKRSVWDVHFENIATEYNNVFYINTPAVISNNTLRVDFEVTLDQPGEEYSFYVDVVNNSTFDVTLDTLTIEGLTPDQEYWITPTVTYSDGITPLHNDILKENTFETFKISVKYNDNIITLPSEDEDFDITVQLKYNQADSNSKERTHVDYINRQIPGEISVGDEISIGDEHFYVVSSNEDKTVLLTKYNLYVGEIYKTMATRDRSILETEEGYGIQKSTAIGVNSELNSRVGTVNFSILPYWQDEGVINSDYYDSNNAPQVYDTYYSDKTGDNASIAHYVINYNNYINGLGFNTINARLLTLQELFDIGCSTPSCAELPANRQFVTSTSYWLQTAYIPDPTKVYQVLNTTSEYRSFVHTYNYGVGVRPVLEVDTNCLKGYITVSLDPNGGEVSRNTLLVQTGTTYNNLPTPTRDGYTFVGWNGNNLASPLILGKSINSNTGIVGTNATNATTDYIELDFDKYNTYYVSGLTNKLWSYVAFYDENYNPIGRTSGGARTSVAITKGAYSTSFNEGEPKYVLITQYENKVNNSSDIDVYVEANIMLNPGNSPDAYEPFIVDNNTTVVQTTNHKLKAIWQQN